MFIASYLHYQQWQHLYWLAHSVHCLIPAFPTMTISVLIKSHNYQNNSIKSSSVNISFILHLQFCDVTHFHLFSFKPISDDSKTIFTRFVVWAFVSMLSVGHDSSTMGLMALCVCVVYARITCTVLICYFCASSESIISARMLDFIHKVIIF